MFSEIDVIQARRVPLIYVCPPFCEIEFSSTSEPIIVLNPLPRRRGPTGLIVTNSGGVDTLTWDTVDGAICYNVYAVIDPEDPSSSYVLIAECITEPTFQSECTAPEGCVYVVTVITEEGESDPSPPSNNPGAQIPCPQTGPEIPALVPLPGVAVTWKLVSLSSNPRNLVAESWPDILLPTPNWDRVFDGSSASDIDNSPSYTFIFRHSPNDSPIAQKNVQRVELSGPWLGEELRDLIDNIISNLDSARGYEFLGTELVNQGQLIIGKRYWQLSFFDGGFHDGPQPGDPDPFSWFGVKEYGDTPVGNYRKLFAKKAFSTSCLQIEDV